MPGMKVERRFAPVGKAALDAIEWDVRTALITEPDGSVVFKQEGVEVPKAWSQTATDVLAQKYFRKAGVPAMTDAVEEAGLPKWLWRRSTRPGCVKGGETSARQVFHRLAGCWAYWGWKSGLFTEESSVIAFYEDVCWLLAKQMMAPNSPQWFNTGLHWAYGIAGPPQGMYYVDPADEKLKETTSAYERPLSHACFLLGLKDDLVGHGGIMDLWCRESRIFKMGGGAGSNISNLRADGEHLSGGGKASGPMSFIKVGDANAGAIKSGGTTRRAAKLWCMNDDHPDLLTFITLKRDEEMKVAALAIGSAILRREASEIRRKGGQAALGAELAGMPECVINNLVRFYKERGKDEVWIPREYDLGWRSEAYATVTGQNANNSVRLSNGFMEAVLENKLWELKWRLSGEVARAVDARYVWDQINVCSWQSADPGVQFDDTINEWNPIPEMGRINTSNPCQPGFATVLTKRGIRTFDDVSVGSVIWSGQRWTTVTRKIATGIKEVFRYVTRAGVFVGTADHQVFQNGKRVRAEDAEMIDRWAGQKCQEIQPINQSDVMAGLVIGDGGVKVCNGGADHYPNLTVGEKDEDYFDEPGLKDLIGARLDRQSFRVETDVVRAETPAHHERRVPDRYFGGDAARVRGFLRGLYSANGSICGGRVTMKMTSRELVEQVQMMLSFLGIVSYHTVNREKDVEFANGTFHCRQSYDVNVTSEGRHEFRRQIGFIQKDKAARLDEVCKVPCGSQKTAFEVIAVESLGEMPVWDITVEADEHCYWTGGLVVSNCAEYNSVDDSACNLLSHNLILFLGADGVFEVDRFVAATELGAMILEITVAMAQLPSPEIAVNTYRQRQLGLGYANLGTLLMALGFPYDSDQGRAVAAAVTCIQHSTVYATSARMARALGPFADYAKCKDSFLKVMRNHRAAAFSKETHPYEGIRIEPPRISPEYCPSYLLMAARAAAAEMVSLGEKHGYRNAQASVQAPTGTISLVMDCDATGVEPAFSLVTWKSLAGGGSIKLVNQSVGMVLRRLKYVEDVITRIVAKVEQTGFMDPDDVHPEHLAIFDAALGRRPISPEGHVRMLAAISPFISGCASKTLNVPEDWTVEDFKKFHWLGWTLAVKAMAAFRNGSKLSQPLESFDATIEMDEGEDHIENVEVLPEAGGKEERKRYAGEKRCLPDRRLGYTQKVRIGETKIYLRTGEYLDGTLGEIFVDLHKEGATFRSVMSMFSIAVSIALQHGTPLEAFVERFCFTRFEPSGLVRGHQHIKTATSLFDFIFRELAVSYLGRMDLAEAPMVPADLDGTSSRDEILKDLRATQPGLASLEGFAKAAGAPAKKARRQATGECCSTCGNFSLTRTGPCLRCDKCGTTTGCG